MWLTVEHNILSDKITYKGLQTLINLLFNDIEQRKEGVHISVEVAE